MKALGCTFNGPRCFELPGYLQERRVEKLGRTFRLQGEESLALGAQPRSKFLKRNRRSFPN